MSNKIIYDTDKIGPMKGIRNGDRKYLMDMSNMKKTLGSFHIFDGSRVSIMYSGQRRTCGRCHQTSRDCPGGGLAKNCYEKNGPKVDLIDHMKSHWNSIGYEPASFNIDDANNEDCEDITIKELYS